jgi:hypothetical protein
MQEDARTLMQKCQAEGIDVYRYGADLPAMAATELRQNIWAVRFLYWHILNRGLCLRPPWSMVEHIGFDAEATNTRSESWIKNPPLNPCPPIPGQWPGSEEHPSCARLHQEVCGTRPTVSDRLYRGLRRAVSRVRRAVSLR